MDVNRFLQWYPRYRQAFTDPVYHELYKFIASPQSIWAMAQASEAGKPALNGIVKELENKFEDRFDFHNPTNRRMIGSMIKEVIHDFGFRRKGQSKVSNSQYFLTASIYQLEKDKAEKTVSGLFEVQDVSSKTQADAEKKETENVSEASDILNLETKKHFVRAEDEKHKDPALMSTDCLMEKELEALIQTLDDENISWNSKRKALEKLGSIGRIALNGVPSIKSALNDQALARTAVHALVQVAGSVYKNYGVADIIFEFTRMLRHQDPERRLMAAEALGEIGAPGATEAAAALAEALKDEDAGVREKAAWALYRIGHPAFKTASSALAEALEDEDEKVRLEAARAIGVCVPTSVDLLVKLLEHENPYVCRMAAFELGEAGEYARIDAAQGLLKALESADKELKATAAWALGCIGETAEGTVKALSKFFRDDTAHVREKAVWSLGMIGAKFNHFDTTFLIEALDDENKNVRKAATWALGYISQKAHNQNPTSRLMDMLYDESKDVQEKAAWALGKLGERSSMGKPCVPLLIEALSDDAWTLRKAAAQALGRIGFFATQALPKLAAIQENREEKEIVRDVAGWAIQEISKYKDDDK